MSHNLLIDATSIFAFQQHLKQQGYPVHGNINYAALLDALRGSKNVHVNDENTRNPDWVYSESKGIRVNQLARELNIASKSILDKLRDEGLGEKAPNHMSLLPLGLAKSVREWFTSAGNGELGSRPRPFSGSAPGPRNTSSSSQFDVMFAFVAINPDHEGQQKFCAFLPQQGFTVDETDFRDAFIVPNREYPYQRLSTRLTYIAGMLTAPYDKKGQPRQLPHLLVITDAFDVYYPLLDYVQNRNGQVTIAFFKRGMEERWQRAGLFDDGSPIKFRDLSDDAKSIIGADLSSSVGSKEGGKGLADFKL